MEKTQDFQRSLPLVTNTHSGMRSVCHRFNFLHAHYMDANQYIQAPIQTHTVNTELTQTPAENLAVAAIARMMSYVMCLWAFL